MSNDEDKLASSGKVSFFENKQFLKKNGVQKKRHRNRREKTPEAKLSLPNIPSASKRRDSQQGRDVNQMEQYLQWRKKRANMLGGQSSSILLDLAVQGLVKGPGEREEANAKERKRKELRETKKRTERERRKKAMRDDSIPLEKRLRQLQEDLKQDSELQTKRQSSKLYREFNLSSSESAPTEGVAADSDADSETVVLRLVAGATSQMSKTKMSAKDKKKARAKDRDRKAQRQQAKEFGSL
jgi:hypothetical protein